MSGSAGHIHPNVVRLVEAMRRMGFGRITEITVANGVPLKFRVEQLVDLSKDEQPSLGFYASQGFDINRDKQ